MKEWRKNKGHCTFEMFILFTEESNCGAVTIMMKNTTIYMFNEATVDSNNKHTIGRKDDNSLKRASFVY